MNRGEKRVFYQNKGTQSRVMGGEMGTIPSENKRQWMILQEVSLKSEVPVSSLCWMEISGWPGSSTYPMMKYGMLNTIISSWARWDLVSSIIRSLVYKGIWIFLFAVEPPSWNTVSRVNIQMNEKGSVCNGWAVRETDGVSFSLLLLLHFSRHLC